MPEIPEIFFRQFAAQVDLETSGVPLEGTIETTFRCNLNCAHCFVNEPAYSPDIRDRELSQARLCSLIDEIAEAGCLGLLFTGGEVLIRPDFPDVYLHALHQGLLVTVFTNGTLITDRIADLFDQYRPERVEISLYGMTRETCERITRVPGSHAKCLQGIQRLHAQKIPFRLKTMVMAWNRHEIPAMVEYAKRLGVGFTYDGLLNPRIDCGANRTGELQLTAEEILAVDLQDPDRAGELRDFCLRVVHPDAVESSQHVNTCGAGRSAFAVDPYGSLHPCVLTRKAGYNVRSDSFARGWNGHFASFRARAWKRPSPCRTCSLISLCGSCPAAAELEHGDAEGLVVEFCRVTHLRAQAAMGEASGHQADASCCLAAVTPSGRTRELAPPECCS